VENNCNVIYINNLRLSTLWNSWVMLGAETVQNVEFSGFLRRIHRPQAILLLYP